MSGGELEFSGSWSGLGRRHTISLGGERSGSVVNLKGTMLLTGPGRPGIRFLRSNWTHRQRHRLTGRSVWTGARRQVFSELRGEGTAAKNHIAGTFLSGTGRYAGVTGSYEFSWQWVMEGEEGAVHGRAVDLHGRVQFGPAAGGSPR